jgi:hypothetical protein
MTSLAIAEPFVDQNKDFLILVCTDHVETRESIVHSNGGKRNRMFAFHEYLGLFADARR